MTSFFSTLKSEYIKQKRSTVSSVVILGALFLPAIVLTARLVNASRLPTLYRTADFWKHLWGMSWESITLIILPMIVIMVASLIVQIEYRNNAWKQVHTTPQSLAAIFFAKQFVILGALLGFFLVLNLGIYAAGILPPLLLPTVPLPHGTIPFALLAYQNTHYFLDILPIVAVQYLLALHFRNFIVPLGIGLAQWLAVIGCLSWKYLYIFPYACIALDYVAGNTQRSVARPPVSWEILAVGYYVVITAISFLLYATKKDRG